MTNYYYPIFNENTDSFIDHEIKDSKSFEEKYPSGVTCRCNSANITEFLEFVEHCQMHSHKEYLKIISSTYLKEILKRDDIIRKYEKIIQNLRNQILENTLSARSRLWL